MHRTQTLAKVKQLSPVLLTALAVVSITGIFMFVSSTQQRHVIKADVVKDIPVQQAGIAPTSNAFLPVAAAYQEILPSPTSAKPQTGTTASNAVPILMYHYIRDYTNANDQVGY